MKKILCCIPLTLVALASCTKQQPSVSQETIDMARALASSMKKGQEAYNGYVRTSSFALEYRAAYQTDNDNQTSSVSQDYLAEANLTFGYALNPENGDTAFDLGEIYNHGSAYFEGSQREINRVSHQIQVKNGFNKGDQSLTEDYSYHHLFGIEFNHEELKARGTNAMEDRIRPSNDRADSFSGKIDKEIVSGHAKESIESAFKKVIYLDSWSNVSYFQSAIMSFFKDLSLDNPEQVSSFMSKNNVSLSEENGVIHATFELKGSDVLSYISKKANLIQKNIICTCTVNANKQILTAYDYNFKGVYEDLLSLETGDKKQYEFSVDRFYLRGSLSDIPFSQWHLNGNFQEYTAENASEFMQGFIDNVIPHIAQ